MINKLNYGILLERHITDFIEGRLYIQQYHKTGRSIYYLTNL